MGTMRKMGEALKQQSIAWIVGVSGLILFSCSSVRHQLFQSNGWDLGIFDQAVYLISQGQPPISSLLGFHILADHAAVIFYPLALLYKIYPTVYWLLAVQAIALSIGGFLIWQLAQQAALKKSQSTAVMLAYLLYPLIFNVNLFDFHPDVIALPGLLAAVLAARSRQLGWFCLAIALVLSCKEAIALTVAGLGVWLLFEQRRKYGAIALVAGIVWFLLATQVIIPQTGGAGATIGRHLSLYSNLGGSFSEIAANLLFKPWLLFQQIFALPNLEYGCLLLVPVLWGLSFRHLAPLMAAVPQLAMNLLTNIHAQKDLVHQYSLPILPFLLLAVISALAAGKGWRSQRKIILWSLVAFLALAKYPYFGSLYLDSLDTWSATRTAIAQIQPQDSVLTTHNVVPHLSHRSQIQFTIASSPPADLAQFQDVLLNLRHPGWQSSPEFAQKLRDRLQKDPRFHLSYQQDDVYLFTQKVRAIFPS